MGSNISSGSDLIRKDETIDIENQKRVIIQTSDKLYKLKLKDENNIKRFTIYSKYEITYKKTAGNINIIVEIPEEETNKIITTPKNRIIIQTKKNKSSEIKKRQIEDELKFGIINFDYGGYEAGYIIDECR